MFELPGTTEPCHHAVATPTMNGEILRGHSVLENLASGLVWIAHGVLGFPHGPSAVTPVYCRLHL